MAGSVGTVHAQEAKKIHCDAGAPMTPSFERV